MADDKFKLPLSSYEELCKIIKAYGEHGKEASLKDLATLTKINDTIISANNGFLLGVGLIEGGKAKSITASGVRLSRALDHDMPDEIVSAWREVILANDFLNKIVAAVRIRKGMDEATLQGHIAYSAGQPKTPRTTTGASSVVDILRAASLVMERDGKLVPSEGVPTPVTSGSTAENQVGSIATVQSSRKPSGAGQNISVHIEIHVDAKASELEGLGAKLRVLLDEACGEIAG